MNHLGLPWEDGVLDFHKARGAVRTASVNQVRQEMYATSVQAWASYSEHLSTLLDGLDPALWAGAMTGIEDS